MVIFVSNALISRTYSLDDGTIYAPSDGQGTEPNAQRVLSEIPAPLAAHIEKINAAEIQAEKDRQAEIDRRAAEAEKLLNSDEEPAGG